MENKELLKDMFELQGQLNQRIGVNTISMPEEKKTEWILNYCRAMSQELAELTDSVPWKWWAKYQEFDKQNAKVEVIDLFHFLISIAQTLDMTAEDVHDLYCRKHRVNQERQDSGYTTKDESDNRSLE